MVIANILASDTTNEGINDKFYAPLPKTNAVVLCNSKIQYVYRLSHHLKVTTIVVMQAPSSGK